jgi:hypothetical protein
MRKLRRVRNWQPAHRLVVANMARPANVVGFHNKRGTRERGIKEGKGAIRWTRLSCRSFAANAVPLLPHALAYTLGHFPRPLATPQPIEDGSPTSLGDKLIEIGAMVVSHGRHVAFQMAEAAIPRNLFADVPRLVAEPRPPPVTSTAWRARVSCVRQNPRETPVSVEEDLAFGTLDAALAGLGAVRRRFRLVRRPKSLQLRLELMPAQGMSPMSRARSLFAWIAALIVMAAFSGSANAGGTLRIGMTASDIPLTTGQTDNGGEGQRFIGYTLYDSLIEWDLTSAD